jgi:phosphate starvation-inducible PhoH-like protein
VDEAALATAVRMADTEVRREGSAIRTPRRIIEPRSAMQAHYLEALGSRDLVIAVGPAGTGKTYLAVAAGVTLMMEGRVDRLILSRPAVEAGERLGFLPGDVREKVDPYLRPLYDALYDMLPPETVHRKLESGEIEIAPLAFMRGRTLGHSYVILDEAQNATPVQMKMFVTRLGEQSRMVVTGDPSQVDLPGGAPSGLDEVCGILSDVEGVSVVRFTEADVVRHPLVTRIVEAYNAKTRGRGGRGGQTRQGGALRTRGAAPEGQSGA